MVSVQTFAIGIIAFFVFMFLSGGGYLFWRRNKVLATPSAPSNTSRIEIDDGLPRDAIISDWQAGKCRTFSGQCGRGEQTFTRQCIQDGKNGGIMCSSLPLHETKECYVTCLRPTVVDWGHPNDSPYIPPDAPRKGWYDITGQGEPNDYCRFVGPSTGAFWACHTQKDAYVKTDPKHVTFSTGPAHTVARQFSEQSLIEKCPDDLSFLAAKDPDLRKSIANGFFIHCGSPCVYDHRNPKMGWTWNGQEWKRVLDMSQHACGTTFKSQQTAALQLYEALHGTQQSWTM